MLLCSCYVAAISIWQSGYFMLSLFCIPVTELKGVFAITVGAKLSFRCVYIYIYNFFILAWDEHNQPTLCPKLKKKQQKDEWC